MPGWFTSDGDAFGAYPDSYYAATAISGPACPKLVGQETADVCIVGGGFSGLSAALRLQQRGARTVLLESGPLGWGASGRNGGQVHVGMRRDQLWLERKLGQDDARKLWDLALDARSYLDVLMEDHGVSCDYRPGYLHADHKPAYALHSRRMADHLRDHYGYSHVRYVDRDEVRSMVATDGYHGGMFDERGGHLHPLNLTLGIAAAASRAGATLHAGSHVTGIRRSGARWLVETAEGSVTADKILLACGGYLRGLNRKVDAHVMPIRNYIGVTAPLGQARAQELISGSHCVADSRFVVYYYRMTPDYRLLFGGGETYSYRSPRNVAAFVRPHIAKIFPGLAEVPIDYAWGGNLSITTNRLPFIRELKPGLFNVSGFSGLGVILAPYFGRVMGDALMGDGTHFNKLAGLPIPGFPGGSLLRWPTLAAAMMFFALRDRL